MNLSATSRRRPVRHATAWAGACAAAAMIAVACGSDAATPTATAPARSTADRGVYPPTPTTVPLFSEDPPAVQPEVREVPDAALVGIVEWVNGGPLTLEEAWRGGAVLLDFWTYTCINCIRTFPFLRALDSRYRGEGLTIIGVHSPEFEFERLPANVRTAVERYELQYPIAIDSDKRTWDLFGNRFWPSTFLFDSNGDLVYRHFGEGGYIETETAVRRALEASGRDLAAVGPLMLEQAALAAGAHTVTREIYAGYERGYELDGIFAAQGEYYNDADATVTYEDAQLRRHGQFELHGLWRNEKDGVVHARATEAPGDYFVFPFFATSVNIVLSAEQGGAAVEIELDGAPIAAGAAGADVSFDSGRSYVEVSEPRLYGVVELAEFGAHELTVRLASPGVKIYNVTFGIYEAGP